jgi:hypothetical protein
MLGQTRTPVLPRGQTIGLRKGVEDSQLVLGGDADTGIADFGNAAPIP